MDNGRALPKWVEERYWKLWEQWQETPFDFEQAVHALDEKRERLSVILSNLKEAGFLEVVELDPGDARKRRYMLVNRLALKPTATESRIAEEFLWRAADLVRARVRHDLDYLVIFVLLFLKKMSENQVLAESETSSKAHELLKVPDEFLWHSLKNTEDLSRALPAALRAVAKNNDNFRNLLESARLDELMRRQNAKLLRDLFQLVDSFPLQDASAEVVVDSYESMLRSFVALPQIVRHYTPRDVVKLLVELLDPQPHQSIYDPACGSGGTLILSCENVKTRYGINEAATCSLYGQEKDPKVAMLAWMNIYMHGVQRFSVAAGDTLFNPQFRNGELLQTFDGVLAAPPWNAQVDADELQNLPLFDKQHHFFRYPSRSSADWLWIQHSLAATKKGGHAVLVFDTGCLFREREKKIRAEMIREDVIEAVVLLPEKLFSKASVPSAVLVLGNDKPADRKGKVLFINASSEFEAENKATRKITDAHIERIASVYKEFKEERGFAKVVSLAEIAQNDYNLNVVLYVSIVPPQEEIDIQEALSELESVDKDRAMLEQELRHRVLEAERITRFDEAERGELPEGWQRIKIGSIMSLELGKKLPKGAREGGSYPVYGSGGRIGHHSQFLVKGPGIVVGRAGTTGKVTWINEDFWPIDTTYYVRPMASVDLKWLYYALSSLDLVQLSTATTIPHLNRKLVQEIQIDMPTLEEQKTIATILSLVDEMRLSHRTSEAILRRINQGLMGELLAGRAQYGE